MSFPTEPPTEPPLDPVVMFSNYLKQMALYLLLVSIVFHALAIKYGCFHELVRVLKDGNKRFNFQGRASRYEFVSYAVSQFLILLDAAIFDVLVGTNIFVIVGLFWILAFLILVVPGYAVTVRRIHDLGQTGLWLIAFMVVPSVGQIGTLVLCLTQTQLGDNQYGPSPLAGSGSVASEAYAHSYHSANTTREAALIPMEAVTRGMDHTGYVINQPPMASLATTEKNSTAISNV